MTKEETAKFLAKNVLGWEHRFNTCRGGWSTESKLIEASQIESFIFSPEGFFEVAEGLRVAQQEGRIHLGQAAKIQKAWSRFPVDMDMEAFYNAVIQAWKEKEDE